MISDIIEEETFNGKEVSNESIKRSCTEPNCEEWKKVGGSPSSTL